HWLGLGETVVLDASFASAHRRDVVRRLAAGASAEVVELRCTFDADEAARRMARRQAQGGDASDADAGIAARLAADADPWPQATDVPTDGRPEAIDERAADLV